MGNFSQEVSESIVNRAIYFHYPHYRVSPPCSLIIVGKEKLLHFYDWPNDQFFYDLEADLGEQSNIAIGNLEASQHLQQQLMDHLNSVGAYLRLRSADGAVASGLRTV